MTINRQELGAAWGEFLGEFGGHAVTLSYNQHHVGTASPCYRITPDGEYLRLRGSGVAARYGVNRISGARRISLEQVHADLDRLHGRVDRKLFGARFNKLPADQRTAFVGFVEHLTSNAHIHVAWRAPIARAEEFIAVVTEVWLATGPAATINVQPIRDAGWGRYITKDQHGEAEAALFVASRTAARV
jgi:hypothetical protein